MRVTVVESVYFELSVAIDTTALWKDTRFTSERHQYYVLRRARYNTINSIDACYDRGAPLFV